MLIAACVGGEFLCRVMSLSRVPKALPSLGDFREYGSTNSGSCRGEEILLAAGETSPKASTLLGRRGGRRKSIHIDGSKPGRRALHAFSSGWPCYALLKGLPGILNSMV